MVTILPVAAVWMASRTASWKTSTGPMTWSAAKEPMMMFGLRRYRMAAASPIAAAESRGSGSNTRFSSQISFSWLSTAPRCARPVTTIIRSLASGTRRS